MSPIRALVLSLSLTLTLSGAPEALHPRLLFSSADVPALREKIKREPYRSMAVALREIAELDQHGTAPNNPAADYDQSVSAIRCSFLYVLTGDDTWAKKARGYVEHWTGSPRWANPGTKGLTLYTGARSVMLAYDWCYGAPSWDTAFTESTAQKLSAMSKVIFENGGREQNTNPASNWQGLRWSVSGLLRLGLDEPVNPAELEKCFALLRRYFAENVGPDPRSRGWNSEGLGYTFYPMGNGVVDFAIALKRHDPSKDLRQACAGAAWSLWTCYAALVKTDTGLWHPDFSDDNPAAVGEGCYGYAFYFSPPSLQPGMKYWYDRTVGLQGDRSFDRSRLGIIASILFYPDTSVVAQDPLTIPEWREAFADTGGNGMQSWRNAYQGTGDLLAQFYVKLRGNRGHNGPDALSFRIVGLNTLWAVGGGRYGKKTNGQEAYWRNMNTVYPVDPDTKLVNSEQSGQLVGTPVILPDGGGHAVARIARNNVGTGNHRRWFAADHSKAAGAEAAYVIYDTSDDGRFWQFCTLDTQPITTEGNT
ncbi:MAG: hypothetical protein H7Y06_00160, partial [Opitutaceae bacterium]|nr:hypothetical protein [Opitutaceae bacterium]